MVTLKAFFASIPYQLHVDAEAYYHSIFYSIFKVLDFKIDGEVAMAKGRIDAVVQYAENIYVFEFKYAHCPTDAKEEERKRIAEGGGQNMLNYHFDVE